MATVAGIAGSPRRADHSWDFLELGFEDPSPGWNPLAGDVLSAVDAAGGKVEAGLRLLGICAASRAASTRSGIRRYEKWAGMERFVRNISPASASIELSTRPKM